MMGTRNNAEHINSLPESYPRPIREGLRALGGVQERVAGDQRGRRAQGASGSAISAVGAPKGRVAVRLTLPLGIERTESARPRGEWQCAWYAQGRVEVQFTLPLDVERAGRNVQGRVAA